MSPLYLKRSLSNLIDLPKESLKFSLRLSEIILIGYKIFIEILATTINIITAIEKMPRKNINLSLYLIADNILKIFDNL
jgi:hypothetical protein